VVKVKKMVIPITGVSDRCLFYAFHFCVRYVELYTEFMFVHMCRYSLLYCCHLTWLTFSTFTCHRRCRLRLSNKEMQTHQY